MHKDFRQRELRLHRVRLDDRATRTGRSVTQQVGQRCLSRADTQIAAEAREVLANRTGSNLAARFAPIKVGDSQHGSGHVGCAAGQWDGNRHRRHAETFQLGDRRGEFVLPRCRTNVVGRRVIDGAVGSRAVSLGGASQIAEHFAHRVAATARDAEHRRKRVVNAARFEQLAVRPPAIPTMKGVRRCDVRRRLRRSNVMIGMERQERRVPFEQHRPEVRHAGDRPDRRQHRRQLGGGHLLSSVDRPRKVSRVHDRINVPGQLTLGQRREHRLENLLDERLQIDQIERPRPVEIHDIGRGNLPPLDEMIGDSNRRPTSLVNNERDILRSTAGTGGVVRETASDQADRNAQTHAFSRGACPARRKRRG